MTPTDTTANDEILTVDELPITGEIVLPGERSVTGPSSAAQSQKAYLLYIFLPVTFLTVTLLGGLRLSGTDRSFIFLPPSLFCLIAASVLMVLFIRAGLVRLDGWFAENFDLVKNVANGLVL